MNPLISFDYQERSTQVGDTTLICSNFFRFQNVLMIFFMDRCSFSVRRRWNRLERSENELERVKRKKVCCCMNGDTELQM